MLPERTTTMGDGESVATERPFHSMNAVESTRAKLRSWVSSCRGWRPPSIAAIGEKDQLVNKMKDSVILQLELWDLFYEGAIGVVKVLLLPSVVDRALFFKALATLQERLVQ